MSITEITNTNKLLVMINSFYGKNPADYEQLKLDHSTLILYMQNLLISVEDQLPKVGNRVFAVQDLSVLGKGIFVHDYFYDKIGFIANIHDCDPYGFITHWVDTEVIDELVDFDLRNWKV